MYGRIEIPGFVRTTTSIEAFFEKVFPFSAMQQAHEDSAFFHDRAILTTRNDTVAQINDCILERMARETRTYEATDSVDVGEGEPDQTTIW